MVMVDHISMNRLALDRLMFPQLNRPIVQNLIRPAAWYNKNNIEKKNVNLFNALDNNFGVVVVVVVALFCRFIRKENDEANNIFLLKKKEEKTFTLHVFTHKITRIHSS